MGLLRFYPADYREAHGQEILAVHRELTAELNRLDRLRADADLIGHAIRLRVGLDAAAPAGRVFATAAPLATGVATAYAAIQLMRWYAAVVISPGSTWSQLATTDLRQGVQLAALALICAAGIRALTRGPTTLVTIGLLAYAAEWPAAPGLYDAPIVPIAAVLTALVLKAAPPETRERRLATLSGAMAAVAWFPAALVLTRNFIASTDYGLWPLATLTLTAITLTITRRSLHPELTAVAIASPLFLTYAIH
ncbi:hypothetical protein HPO96_21165 [Kribbella sandramycini]|uniref:Uncharacterized protein n=1 Tax=Kribbella sandramycini TaxID=60450 RepID=A0A7Y4L1S0_9ACTN|nr:hypothetical protein [Kribbella sandramycini]MBB6566585.1 hypothetical protein [Kribbella sandramycini]NOL42760.1 hypothetical protein [Kribbella sandramycini]